MLHSLRFIFCSLLIYSASTLIFSHKSGASYLRVGGGYGFGESVVTSNGQYRSESPMAFIAFVDYSYSSRYVLGAEHFRTISSSGSTAVGVTGMAFKWYFWTPHPQYLKSRNEKILETTITQKNIVPYLGASLGFGQSSILARDEGEQDTSSVGLMFGVKSGLEYPIYKRYGLRGEFNYANSIAGSGSIETYNLTLSLMFYL